MRQPIRPSRIMLIHALRESVAPIHAAFAEYWPEARTHDLLDSSLSADHAAAGGVLDAKMMGRFRSLTDYAAMAGPEGGGSDAILFTCSAFAPAIEAARRSHGIPILKPNEGAFAEALGHGGRIGLLVSFAPSLASMADELKAAGEAVGKPLTIEARLVEGALAALQAGRPEEHDALIARAAAALPAVDSIVIGQFSMARAAPAVRAAVPAGLPVLTTPQSAVMALRQRLASVPVAAG
ncbi:aspartate/glutamate racemase family protein [Roseomonas marmotae]|uniref:Arylsulfatase n=1 Tax=Roseomonas marmotae TaxID=2768161 RepID=A0ABS3KB00_9PROT|nr:aspartate/glutamate racemase family protein [Roseomonas marmotae]MBO1074633.1 arylsulfatase [Roseomonas marmotae]QTI81654.1 arylsulfatase [Roseomonas marmotae]